MSVKLNPRIHINKPVCPCCQDGMQLSINVDNVYSLIWCCNECGYKQEQNTGNVTSVVTREFELLKYNVRIL